MADDKTFEIKILQTTEGTAIQDSAEGLSNLTKKTEQSGDAAHESGISHRTFHQILHEIGHVAGPEAAAAMAGLTAIFLGGGISIGVLAVRELFEGLERSKKAAEAVRDTLAEWKIKQLDDHAEAMNSVADAAERYATAVANIGTGEDKLKTKYETDKAVLDAIITQHAKLLEALEKEGNVPAGTSDLFKITAESDRINLRQAMLRAKIDADPGLHAASDAAEKKKEAVLGTDMSVETQAVEANKKSLKELLTSVMSPGDIGEAKNELVKVNASLEAIKDDRTPEASNARGRLAGRQRSLEGDIETGEQGQTKIAVVEARVAGLEAAFNEHKADLLTVEGAAKAAFEAFAHNRADVKTEATGLNRERQVADVNARTDETSAVVKEVKAANMQKDALIIAAFRDMAAVTGNTTRDLAVIRQELAAQAARIQQLK